MFFSGAVADIIIALIIGRIDVVYIVGALFALPGLTVSHPSACLVVLGADFTFASRTMFISKVSPTSEQSVSGALFPAMTQIGSAIGLSVSTIVFNGVLRAQSGSLGVSLDQGSYGAPPAAQFKAYRAVMWTGFTFGILCEFRIPTPRVGSWFHKRLVFLVFFFVPGTVPCLFLRGAGIVGATPSGKTSYDNLNSLDVASQIITRKSLAHGDEQVDATALFEERAASAAWLESELLAA